MANVSSGLRRCRKGGDGVAAVDEREREELVDALLDRLRSEGAPAGAWLVDIAEVRRALQEADALLRRLQDAIMRGASESRRREP